MVDRRQSFLAAVALTFVSCTIVCGYINIVQPESYMDEVFHEDQTLTYIRGHWDEWNPKITTPPGLYVLTTFIWDLLKLPASISYFRYVNCFLAGINLFLLSELTQNTLKSVAIATLPVLYFTSIIFYTDQLSLCAVLVTFLAHRSYAASSAFSDWLISLLAGIFACLVRQTNVVWLAFLIGQEVVRRLAVTHPGAERPLVWLKRLLYDAPVTTLRAIITTTLQDTPHMSAIIAGFAALVYFLNDGDIVLGDRSAHKPAFHVPQIFYFFVFCAAHTAYSFIKYVWTSRGRLVASSSHLLAIGFTLALITVAVYNFTIEHKYLLADNRHYAFYVWSKFFRRFPLFRYVVIPVYLVAGSYVAWGCRGGDNYAIPLSSFLTTVGFLVCTALALVPAALIEPRYFITPYVVWRLCKPGDNQRTALFSEIGLNVFSNVVTIYIFVFHPFRWFSQPFTWQRFMW